MTTYQTIGEKIATEAWEAFERWCRKYDPEGNMDTLDLAEAYDQFAVAPDPQDRWEGWPEPPIRKPK